MVDGRVSMQMLKYRQMVMVGIILFVGLVLVIFAGAVFLNNSQKLVSPVPTNSVRVIFITPKPNTQTNEATESASKKEAEKSPEVSSEPVSEVDGSPQASPEQPEQ